MAWDASSESIWLLIGGTNRSGFTTGPLSCARLFIDGRVESTPALSGLPGQLDQVDWVNATGVGVAHMDLLGGSERNNRNPGLAIIEASRGSVRSVLPFRDTVLHQWGVPDAGISTYVRAAVELPDGRVRVLAWMATHGTRYEKRHGLLVWTEGEPFAIVEGVGANLVGSMDPSGKFVLAAEAIQPGGITFDVKNPPPLTPRSGVYASRWDVGTRRRVWTRSGVASTPAHYPPVAISQDGERGAVGQPERCQERPLVGIVALDTGRIVRRLAPSAGSSHLGFHMNQPWVYGGGKIEFYAQG